MSSSKTDRFFLATPHRLIASPHPSPDIFLSFDRVELGDQGKLGNQDGALSWRLIMAPLFNFKRKHGFCQNAAWSFSSVAYYFLDRLKVIKRRYFTLNKKTQVCLQTLASVTKH